MGATLLEARGVSKRFGAVRALDGVDVRVDSGEIVGLIGPNGSGKTTFFNCVSGFARPERGEVRWQGRSVRGWTPEKLARNGVVRTFQQVMLFRDDTVGGSITQALRCAEGWGPRTARNPQIPDDPASIAALVDLDAGSDVPVGAMSHGLQKLVGVAMALASGPTLLMLDEPVAGLHAGEARTLGALLRRLRGLGVTTLIIDHHAPFVLSLCDRIVVLDAGRNLVEGTPAEIRAHPDVLRVYLGEEFEKSMATTGEAR
jgi:ABC-type branched-subunit amino acid transport system ATPase component